MRQKVGIIGHFGKENASDGQTVKTQIVADELERMLGKNAIKRIDTYNWRKHPLNLFYNCVHAVWSCDNILFLTDEGGIRVFPRLLRLANITGRCKLHYYVVGGWLHDYLDRSESAAQELRKLDCIYVEVPAMLRELEDRNFRNGILLNKFRRMTPVSATELALNPSAPYKLCYFSRVMKEKGIEECISAVKLANERAGFVKYVLDIYGSIKESYKETFETLMHSFPDFIRYGGIIDFQKSSLVLKDYFVMLFPTYYTSEGYPNAIVDAFAAGLPVIATRWNYNADIIRDHEDGILVDVGQVEQIVDAIEEMSENADNYGAMRLNCLARCKEYLPETAMSKVIAQLK